MRTAMKRITAALLAAMLLLSLTACGEKREAHKVNWVTAPAYEAEDVALPVRTGDLLGSCTDGAYMYVLADTKEEEVKSHLLRVSLTDGEAVELAGFETTVVPDGGIKNTLGPVLAPDGTMWLYEMWSITYYDLPEDFDPKKENKSQYCTDREDFHHLRQLDPATGRQKKLVDLSDAVRALDVSNVLDIAGFAVDGRGNIYFAGTGGVAVMDGRGKYLFTLEASLPNASFEGTSGGPLALLPDGSVAALTIQPGGKRTVRSIDVSAKGWGAEKYELPGGVDLLYSGTSGFLFYYISAGALWAWEPEAEEGRMLLSWSAADVPGSRMCFAPLDGGKMAVLALTRNGTITDRDYWYQADIRLSVLSPVDRPPREQRVRLVYGTIGTDSVLRYRIDQFNKENTEYYIELRNYAGENVERNDVRTAEARDAAQKLLSAEVASGQVPDIWDTSLPIDLYARKGVLEDLWPWIDNDPEISRGDLMSHVLDCAGVDGKLYQIFNTFEIDTAAAPAGVVGNRTGWTLEEMLNYYEALPEGGSLMGSTYSKLDLLYGMLYYDLNAWIDWGTGECRFDSEGFRALLSMCGRLGDDGAGYDLELLSREANGVDIREGRQLFTSAWLSGPDDLLAYDAIMGGPQCLMDYEAYLNENHIFGAAGQDGDEWGEDALRCPVIGEMRYYLESGKLWGFYDLAPDAAAGAVEGGGYAVYVGMPADGGSGSRFVLPGWYGGANGRWGISAACQAKEGAWAYIRQFLLPGCSDSVMIDSTEYLGNGFPIRREDFERMLEPRWFQREDGKYVLDQDGRRIENPQGITCSTKHVGGVETAMLLYRLAPSERQMERFWDLYNAIDSVGSCDSTIMNIIQEQAEIYFAGDKTLDETAALIQNRVTLYVNENR